MLRHKNTDAEENSDLFYKKLSDINNSKSLQNSGGSTKSFMNIPSSSSSSSFSTSSGFSGGKGKGAAGSSSNTNSNNLNGARGPRKLVINAFKGKERLLIFFFHYFACCIIFIIFTYSLSFFFVYLPTHHDVHASFHKSNRDYPKIMKVKHGKN